MRLLLSTVFVMLASCGLCNPAVHEIVVSPPSWQRGQDVTVTVAFDRAVFPSDEQPATSARSSVSLLIGNERGDVLDWLNGTVQAGPLVVNNVRYRDTRTLEIALSVPDSTRAGTFLFRVGYGNPELCNSGSGTAEVTLR